jgi:hypothetical protein
MRSALGSSSQRKETETMRRFCIVLAAACALLPALAARPAFAGGGPLDGGAVDAAVANSTAQTNEAGAINVPIASGNNVAIASGGDQSNSAGVEQNQANVNATNQDANQGASPDAAPAPCPEDTKQGQSQEQSASNTTEQRNEAGTINVPIASGNNVAILSGGDQSNSAGVEQNQANANATKQDAGQGGEATRNSTDQDNKAGAINVPIASGNNVAVLSKGRQSNSAGVEQNQANVNYTSQSAGQGGSSYPVLKAKPDGKESDRGQSLRNSTKQKNEAWAVNVPIASGNNIAILAKGRQYNSAGVEQNQANVNYTKQESSAAGSAPWFPKGKPYGNESERGSVRNSTRQKNEAWAVNVPILSGNNVAFLAKGRQYNSAGVEQNQANVNYTKQESPTTAPPRGPKGKPCAKEYEHGSPRPTSLKEMPYAKPCGRKPADASVRNSTRQKNEAWAVNVPILSGNNVAILAGGRQYNSAGVEQNQLNLNATKQEGPSGGPEWSLSPEGKPCEPPCDRKTGGGSVENSTRQTDEAWALNVPILSGNNVAFLAEGRQSNSAGVEQNQANLNFTKQGVGQTIH